jgi:hypothetical protein
MIPNEMDPIPEMPEEPMSSRRRFSFFAAFWSLVLVAVGAASLYLTHEFVIKPHRAMAREFAAQKEMISGLERDNERLETYLRLLKRFERRARVEVLRREEGPGGVPVTAIRIAEIDDEGKPVSAAREVALPGEEFYFDTLVIKFEDHFIEEDDPFKGRALMIFRRVFSNTMKPEDGVSLDVEGRAPQVYAAENAPSEFERDLWKRFWELANNEDLAREKGIRAIHGDAPFMQLVPGKVYEIHLRSTGEVVITPGATVTKPPGSASTG